MPSGRTSMPALQATDLLATLPACSGRRQNHPCRLSHECKLGDQTKDDADKEPREERSCGRSQTSLYNGRRPHSSLDDRTPDQAYFDFPPLRGGLTPADAPLINAELLFRQPEPALSMRRALGGWQSKAGNRVFGMRANQCTQASPAALKDAPRVFRIIRDVWQPNAGINLGPSFLLSNRKVGVCRHNIKVNGGRAPAIFDVYA